MIGKLVYEHLENMHMANYLYTSHSTINPSSWVQNSPWIRCSRSANTHSRFLIHSQCLTFHFETVNIHLDT